MISVSAHCLSSLMGFGILEPGYMCQIRDLLGMRFCTGTTMFPGWLTWVHSDLSAWSKHSSIGQA